MSGWLISQGKVPYRDFFSHHAPFPYFYSAFFHLLAGKHFVLQRFSVALFGLAAFLSVLQRYRHDVSPTFRATMLLFVSLWIVYGRIYWHFLLLSDNYVGYALLVVFGILLHALWTGVKLSRLDHLLLGLFAFAALGSNPHALFPVVGCLPFYGWIVHKAASSGWKDSLWAIGSFSVPAGMLAGYFAWHNAFDLLWQQVVVFNASTYSIFLGSTTDFFTPISRAVYSLFGVTDLAQWDFNPHLLTPVSSWADDRWAYLGLAGRLCLLVTIGYAFARRRFLVGIMLFVVGACSLSRDLTFYGPTEFPWWFHIQHFRILCLLCMCFLLVKSGRAAFAAQTTSGRTCMRLLFGALVVINGIVCVRAVQTVADAGIRMTLERRASIHRWDSFLEWQVDVCTELVGKEGRVSAFPNGCYIGYLGEYAPASFFNFYLPWTASRREDIQRIRNDLTNGAEDNTAVWIHRSGEVWAIPLEEYCADLLELLDDEYTRVSSDVYVSNASRAINMLPEAEARGQLVREQLLINTDPHIIISERSTPYAIPLINYGRAVAVEVVFFAESQEVLPFALLGECTGEKGTSHQEIHITPNDRERRWLTWLPSEADHFELSIPQAGDKCTIQQVTLWFESNDSEIESAAETSESENASRLLKSLWPPPSTERSRS